MSTEVNLTKMTGLPEPLIKRIVSAYVSVPADDTDAKIRARDDAVTEILFFMGDRFDGDLPCSMEDVEQEIDKLPLSWQR